MKEGSVIFYLVIIQKAQYQDGKDPKQRREYALLLAMRGRCENCDRHHCLIQAMVQEMSRVGREGAQLSERLTSSLQWRQHWTVSADKQAERPSSAGTHCVAHVRAAG